MLPQKPGSLSRLVALAGIWVLLQACSGNLQKVSSTVDQSYQYPETSELTTLVKNATELVRTKGEAAFSEFRVSGGRWRQGESYIFVLDSKGNMLVHPDPDMEGKNEFDLKDINGKPIVRGLLGAAMTFPSKPEGWYHYEWPVPGGLLPRWKSSYVRLVTAPSGNRYVVGSGTYNDRMERPFVVDLVNDAVGRIEQQGTAAFPLFHDPTGPFIAKDAYVFVFDSKGIDLVNPGFPNLEGRNLLDLQDAHGKPLVREMFRVVQTRGSGWVDYMWPKPGDSVSTQKSAYVSKAKMGDEWVLVGSGVYLADAPKAVPAAKKMTAPELMTLVRDAAAVFAQRGEQAYAEFRTKGSKWFHDDVYFFVWSMDATRLFHAASPAGEGRNERDLKDIQGRPIGKIILNAGGSPTGEGWIHYMYPEPGGLFPMWKSSFIKRVTFPSGEDHIIGCGLYNMQMDRALITDVVDRAATLVAEQGKDAFGQLRDRTGPFVFMDTYVFVESPDGTEVVNPGHPSLEGKNLMDLKDIKGNPVVKDEIALAMKDGSGWVDIYWYKPGHNTPARKQTFVRKVQSGQETYIVGAGIYVEE
ncbi:MAG TPA: cache domain-containing protein [Nitrospira sp.]|nr:cache domain-containing protein [Nitrospira sp.]